MNIKTYAAIVVFVASVLSSVIPASAQQPWETAVGRACFEEWIREAMGRINRYDGNPDHNARKPWFINQYGILNGNPRYGPTSTAAPDNFRQYQNKYHYMWDYWHSPNSYWRWAEWRAAGVPHIRNYVMNCIREAGGGTGGTPGRGAAGATPTRVDVVQRSERFAGDGVGDWSFRFRLLGSGTVSSITVRNTNGQFSVWDTIPRNGYWLAAVYSGRRSLSRNDGSVMFNVDGAIDLTLYVADNGSLSAGRTRYKIIVKFRDGRVAEFDPALTGSVQAPSPGGGPPPRTAAGASQTRVDVVQRSERFAGDGVGDWSFRFRLLGSGTVSSITVRNTNGQFSVWDTIPRNGYWLAAVYSGQRRLSRNDGSVMFNVDGAIDLTLYVADNGSLSAGRTRYKIIVKFRDGRVAEFDPAVTGTVRAPSPGGGRPPGRAGIEWNVDRPGSDFSNFNLPRADPGLCAEACARDSRCKAWTYVKPNTIQGPNPRCWLKYAVPRAVQRSCCVSGVKTGTSGTTGAGRRYEYPRAGRYRLDWCYTWAQNCGRGAADAFCRANGHSRASNWQMDPDIGAREPTYVIGDRKVCNQSFCDGFKWIQCE
jgi:hypothetical protein